MPGAQYEKAGRKQKVFLQLFSNQHIVVRFALIDLHYGNQ